MPEPTVGRIVNYRLEAGRNTGAIRPAQVVNVFRVDHEQAPPDWLVNLVVTLDVANDDPDYALRGDAGNVMHISRYSVHEGTGPGEWSWPEIIQSGGLGLYQHGAVFATGEPASGPVIPGYSVDPRVEALEQIPPGAEFLPESEDVEAERAEVARLADERRAFPPEEREPLLSADAFDLRDELEEQRTDGLLAEVEEAQRRTGEALSR